MKRRTIIIGGILLAIISCSIAILIMLLGERGIVYTDDIQNYDSGQYYISSSVFPKKIPKNAQVVSFKYFDYWYEATDIYLELRFNSSEEMETYLGSFNISDTSDYIQTKNIYNPSYEEVFSTQCAVWENEAEYTGYTIRNLDSDTMVYECSFETISFSRDELVVIHTFASGWFRENIHEHIPEYFKRFKVPLQEAHRRVFLLNGQSD